MQALGILLGRRWALAAAVGAVALAAGLSGCGGGGGGDDDPPAAAATFPVEATLTQLFATENDMLSAMYVDPANREDYTFATHIAPASDGHKALFEGKEVSVSYLVTSVARNGVKIWDSSATLLYTTAPLVWHGQIDDEGTYSVHTQVTALPEKASVGAHATWLTSEDYTNNTKATLKQRTTINYSLNAGDSATTAWLCLDFQVKEVARPDVTQASTTCLKTNTTGAVLEVRRGLASVR